jgi:hypothetical protein
MRKAELRRSVGGNEVEIGHTVKTKDHGLAVDDELFAAVL